MPWDSIMNIIKMENKSSCTFKEFNDRQQLHRLSQNSITELLSYYLHVAFKCVDRF